MQSELLYASRKCASQIKNFFSILMCKTTNQKKEIFYKFVVPWKNAYVLAKCTGLNDIDFYEELCWLKIQKYHKFDGVDAKSLKIFWHFWYAQLAAAYTLSRILAPDNQSLLGCLRERGLMPRDEGCDGNTCRPCQRDKMPYYIKTPKNDRNDVGGGGGWVAVDPFIPRNEPQQQP